MIFENLRLRQSTKLLAHNIIYIALITIAMYNNEAICASNTSNAKITKSIQEVINIVNNQYIAKVSPDVFTNGAIDGMLKAIDPYSGYFTDSDLEKFTNNINGRMTGIGMEMVKDGPFVRVITVLEKSPAERAGIIADDRVTHINHKSVENMSIDIVIQELSGEIGTELILGLLKASSNKRMSITLKRDIINLTQVTSYQIDNILYIAIPAFTKASHQGIMSELSKAIFKNNLNLDGIIIDLRNNPGGLLESATAISALFMKNDEIITTLYNSQNVEIEQFHAINTYDAANGIPMIILINKESASAAEIMAAALRENNRAILIGEKTFGKASVQDIIALQSRPKSYIKLTIALYKTPLGNVIEKIGIHPDIVVKDTKRHNKKNDITDANQSDPVMAKAIEILKKPALYNEILSRTSKANDSINIDKKDQIKNNEDNTIKQD